MTKVCTHCTCELPVSEFYTRSGRRSGERFSVCKFCKQIAVALWRQANPEKYRESNHINNVRWHKNNLEKARERSLSWRRANPEKARENCRRWIKNNHEKYRERSNAYCTRYRKANPEKRREGDERYRKANTEKTRENSKRWRQTHPGAVNAQSAERRTRKMQATPPWADLKAIRYFYQVAAALSTPDQPYHVDHIIPLRGKLVSGLHVHTNLQILPGRENRSKGNKFTPVLFF